MCLVVGILFELGGLLARSRVFSYYFWGMISSVIFLQVMLIDGCLWMRFFLSRDTVWLCDSMVSSLDHSVAKHDC